MFIIHWFDDFAKSLARTQETRRSALGKLAFAAVAANVPWATRASAANGPTSVESARLPHSVLLRPHTVAPSTSHRGMAVSAHHLLSEYRSGPCEFRVHGRDADFDYRATTSAGGQTLALTVHHRTVVSGTGHALSASATDTIEVTSGGSPVVKVESKRNLEHGQKQSSGTMRFEYGDAVNGINGATLTFVGSSVHSQLAPSSTGTVVARTRRSLNAQFARDAAPVAISVDSAVYDGIKSLMDQFARERKTCAGVKPRFVTGIRKVSSRATFFRTFGKRGGGLAPMIVADEDRAPATYGGSAGIENQNEAGAPSTPNCNSCMNAAANQSEACWESLGVDLLFGCAPCITAAIQCQAEATANALGCWIPGAGCMQTICGPDTGCDTGDTCCGSKCCTGNATCVGQPSTCCPPGYTIACSGANGPFCCASGQMCCGNNLCCDEGSNCCGGFCCPHESECCGEACCSAGSKCANAATSLCCQTGYTVCGSSCCPPNAVCRDGVCCAGAFCGDQCCVNGQLCNQATGQCYYPSFGTPTPHPSGSKLMQCMRPLSLCHSVYRDGRTADVCCTAGLECCAGTCCGPNQQCGGNGPEFACGNWIH